MTSAEDAPETRKGIRSYIRASTAKDAAGSIHKDRINQIIQAKTESRSGSKDWLAHYPRALNHVFSELTEDEVAACEETRDQWNEAGPGQAQKEA